MSLEKPDFTNFESTITALFTRVRGHIEPGAHRMLRLLDANRQSKLASTPTILVAGTNGKGTTCALLEKILRDAGLKTALYTSPHLVCPSERIRLDGRPVSKDVFLHHAKVAFERAQEHLPDATFFELMTCLALDVVFTHGADVFVCEVGLGGRLDSTNVTFPTVSVLTSVGLDHVEWLGNTEKQIAFEKSHVSRRNRPFVIGPVSADALEGIESALAITGAIPRHVGGQSTNPSEAVPANTIELCQEVLLQIRSVIGKEISSQHIMASARSLHWPGRCDTRYLQNVPVLFDGAHNSHGVRFFLNEWMRRPDLRALPQPRTIVYASLTDKDWQESLGLLVNSAEDIIVTQTHNPRAVPAERMLDFIRSIAPDLECRSICSCSDALDQALQRAERDNGTLIVTGSLTLVGEAMEHFKIPVFKEFHSGD